MKKEKLIEIGLDEDKVLKCLELFEKQKEKEKVSIEKYSTRIEELERELEESNKSKENEILTLKKDYALEKAYKKANVRNIKALEPFLDLNEISFAENGEINGLTDKLEKLMSSEDTSFLFKKDEIIETPFLKGAKVGEGISQSDKSNSTSFDSMNYSEMCTYLQDNPDVKINDILR